MISMAARFEIDTTNPKIAYTLLNSILKQKTEDPRIKYKGIIPQLTTIAQNENNYAKGLGRLFIHHFFFILPIISEYWHLIVIGFLFPRIGVNQPYKPCRPTTIHPICH